MFVSLLLVDQYEHQPTHVSLTFLLFMVNINNFRIVSRRISGWTRVAQRVVHTRDPVAFSLQHKRYIACVLDTAPLGANTHVFGVSKISEFSCVYSSNQCDVIMNNTCAALAEIR